MYQDGLKRKEEEEKKNAARHIYRLNPCVGYIGGRRWLCNRVGALLMILCSSYAPKRLSNCLWTQTESRAGLQLFDLFP